MYFFDNKNWSLIGQRDLQPDPQSVMEVTLPGLGSGILADDQSIDIISLQKFFDVSTLSSSSPGVYKVHLVEKIVNTGTTLRELDSTIAPATWTIYNDTITEQMSIVRSLYTDLLETDIQILQSGETTGQFIADSGLYVIVDSCPVHGEKPEITYLSDDYFDFHFRPFEVAGTPVIVSNAVIAQYIDNVLYVHSNRTSVITQAMTIWFETILSDEKKQSSIVCPGSENEISDFFDFRNSRQYIQDLQHSFSSYSVDYIMERNAASDVEKELAEIKQKSVSLNEFFFSPEKRELQVKALQSLEEKGFETTFTEDKRIRVEKPEEYFVEFFIFRDAPEIRFHMYKDHPLVNRSKLIDFEVYKAAESMWVDTGIDESIALIDEYLHQKNDALIILHQQYENN